MLALRCPELTGPLFGHSRSLPNPTLQADVVLAYARNHAAERQ
jgi:hypothetical protein